MSKLLTAAILMTFTSFAIAAPDTDTTPSSPFKGFYVGAGLGIEQFSNKDSMSADISGLPGAPTLYSSFNYYSATNSFNYMSTTLFFGYNWNLNPDFILGVETRFLPSQSYNNNFNNKVSLSIVGSSAEITQSGNNKLEISPTVDFLVKPGFMMNEKEMVYAIIGFGLTQEKLTNNSSYIQSYNGQLISLGEISLTDKESVIPLIFGLGYSQYLTSHLAITGEITETTYPSINTPGYNYDYNGAIIPLSFSTTSISSLGAKIGVNYFFKGI